MLLGKVGVKNPLYVAPLRQRCCLPVIANRQVAMRGRVDVIGNHLYRSVAHRHIHPARVRLPKA